MHELSIALSLIDAAAEEADRRGGLTVRTIHLRLGALSGVEADALASAFELAVEGSAIDGAILEIELVPVVVFCPSCRAERALTTLQRFACPVCDSPTASVVRGKEMEITALEVEP
jgi:hydrogenase nickel incorporation protein HypA/HybF